MNTFEHFLDLFSATDLKKRIAAVVVIGISICLATAVAAAFFLTKVHTIATEGTARFVPGAQAEMEVQLDSKSIGMLGIDKAVTAEFELRGGKKLEFVARVMDIDPQTYIVRLGIDRMPDELKGAGRVNAKLILVKKKYWEFLLNR